MCKSFLYHKRNKIYSGETKKKIFNVFLLPVFRQHIENFCRRQILKKGNHRGKKEFARNRKKQGNFQVLWGGMMSSCVRAGGSAKEKYWLAKKMKNVINSIIMMFPLHLFA
jgi:hypothetical protein